MTLTPGSTVGRYQILGPLGQGGMATVYKAFQPSLEREVALKVLRSGFAQDKEFVERFEREAKAIARLRHPHIVQVFDFEMNEGQYVLAMEFLEGGTLKDHQIELAKAHRGMDPSESVRIVTEVAEALTYAHEQGIVHRDVKPSNVMLTRKDWAVVTDFGIARILGATSHTQTGVGIGTPEYMAPEQGQGGRVDHRADIYSLGAMAYELLTGRVPYTADTPLAVVIAHIKDPLPLPSKVNPTIGPAVERVLLRALAKDPAQRYESAVAFAEALRSGLAEDTRGGTMPTVVVRGGAAAMSQRTAAPPPAPRQVTLQIPPVLARRPVMAGVAGAVVLSLIAGGALVGGAFRAVPEPTAAPTGQPASSPSQVPATSPIPAAAVTPTSATTPAAVAAPGSFASYLGEVAYQPKLDGNTREVTLIGATKMGGGQIEMTAPAGHLHTEVVFNSDSHSSEQYALAMQVDVDAGSTMRFAFCPRSGLQRHPAPHTSYCFTFLLRDRDPTLTLELRYSGGGPENIGAPVTLPKASTFRLGAVIDKDVFRLWVDDSLVLDRRDDRLAVSDLPPLVQASRLGSDPQLGGTVRIRDVKLYRLAGAR